MEILAENLPIVIAHNISIRESTLCICSSFENVYAPVIFQEFNLTLDSPWVLSQIYNYKTNHLTKLLFTSSKHESRQTELRLYWCSAHLLLVRAAQHTNIHTPHGMAYCGSLSLYLGHKYTPAQTDGMHSLTRSALSMRKQSDEGLCASGVIS